MKVNFYDSVEDKFLKFAVIIAKYNGKYVFCKHKERDTYEVPGGHREIGESIEETAKRELKEETGAIDFTIKPICVYSVTGKTRVNESGEESYGGLYFAEIKTFEQELHSEMEKIIFVDEMPDKLTYPEIQPKLMEEAKKRILSGIQPTGTFTLGNYIGAVRNWGKLQDEFECIYMIVFLI